MNKSIEEDRLKIEHCGEKKTFEKILNTSTE